MAEWDLWKSVGAAGIIGAILLPVILQISSWINFGGLNITQSNVLEYVTYGFFVGVLLQFTLRSLKIS